MGPFEVVEKTDSSDSIGGGSKPYRVYFALKTRAKTYQRVYLFWGEAISDKNLGREAKARGDTDDSGGV